MEQIEITTNDLPRVLRACADCQDCRKCEAADLCPGHSEIMKIAADAIEKLDR